MALTATRKKKKVITRRKAGSAEPKWDEWEKLTPENYGRLINESLDYYRLDCKNADYKRYVVEYCKNNEQWKSYATKFSKIPDGRYSSTIGALCRQAVLGRPDVHEEYNKYWESLAGTMGTPRPLSESINKMLEDYKYKADAIIQEEEEVKKEEEKERRSI